ncbi:MAG: hypothetical protein D6767_05015, partial [Candidatus Hydrogenedentota bacterium]
HRKQWEFAIIYHALNQLGFIDKDKIGTIFQNGFLLYFLIWLPRFFGSIPLISYSKNWTHYFKQLFATSVLLGAPLTLLVAIAKIAYDMAVLPKEFYQGAIVCSLLGGLIGPTVFRLWNKE